MIKHRIVDWQGITIPVWLLAVTIPVWLLAVTSLILYLAN